MTRKLAKHGWIEYEHYGKMYLTKKEKQLGQTLVKNHEVLEQFLKMIGVEDAYIVKELYEIEFHISPYLIKQIEILNQYFSQDELRLQSFYQFRNNTIPPLL
ncbi:iron dependent repressor, metal binding and dimerization domain protein [Bacillus salipaludis]|uniref:iron dependent repressor, metal binding and dimerization domain protein n=1 Tax=Bacillus salipaludis TaxID=2547811 RepID=UPI002E214AF2|nr:iron dependent repressor, metal binding and dimerization domain protein [Bacillus salipaludis]